jgi:hypothetical protein
MARMRALVDKLLVDVSNGIFQDMVAFVSERLLTNIGVVQKSGIVGKYGTNHLRVHANAMGGEGKAPRVSLVRPDVSQKYLIQNHGLEDVVTPDDYDDYELPFEAERDKTMHLTYANLIAKEVALSTAMGSAAAVLTQNTTLTGSSQFSDLTNSDPIGVFSTARQTIRAATGFWPNVGLVESGVYEKLRIHPQIWDRLGFKYNQSGQLTQDNVAAAMNVKKLLVTEGVYNSASEGQADVIAPIWGKNLFFAVIADSAGIMQKSLGYYVFNKKRGKRTVFKYAVNNPPESTGIICKDDYDQLLSDVACGYAVYDAIA